MTSSNSESIEMYLKSVAELGGIRMPVPIGRVADRMGVTTVSANEMMKRLVTQGFIEHQPYKGVVLTGKGQKTANNVIRRQRLWECFLVDKLEMDWASSHELACDLEHATADEVANALDKYLGYPSYCPHGNPIPKSNSQVINVAGTLLSEFVIGQKGRIIAIQPEKTEVLSYLYDRGFLPGKEIEILEVAPLEGPLTMRLNGEDVVLGLNLAALITMEETANA